MTLPTFILAGAPKAGSSAFWHYLRQHPEVYLPAEKEPFFFDFNFDKGVEWYADKFAGHRGETAVGEATVWYMRWKEVPERMHSVLPDVKLIFLLRNPTDRAYSNFNHDYRDGRYPYDRTFSDLIRSEDRDDRGIVMAGFYDEHLDRFRRYYSDDQILVLLTDDLRTDRDDALRRTFEFLGVDPTFRPEDTERRNVSWWMSGLEALRAFDAIWRPVEHVTGWSPTKQLWRRSRHFRQLFWDRDTRPPPMLPQDRAFLDDLYRPHLERLAVQIGRPLDEWGGRPAPEASGSPSPSPST